MRINQLWHKIPCILVGSILRILSWILTVCTALGGLAGHIDPSYWAAPSVLCLVLPYLWVTSLVVALAWWCILREKIMTTALICGMLLSAHAMSTVCPLNLPKQAPVNARTFRLMTFNALYSKDQENPDAEYSRSVSEIIRSDADLVCLQEQYAIRAAITHGCATQAQIDSINSIYPYQVNNGNIDVMLLSKYPVKVKYVAYPEQMNFFMYQSYEIDIKGITLTLLNVHLTSYALSAGEREILDKTNNGSFIQSFADLKGSVAEKLNAAFVIRSRAARSIVNYVNKTRGPLIICGDFNDVPASWAYNVIRGAGLRDAYCDAGFGPMITYNQHHLFFHIDQILYRGPLEPLSVERGRLRSSDHYPMIARFAILPEK